MKRTVQELAFHPRKPAGVSCIAADRTKTRLVVCRADGCIETWSCDAKARPYICRQRSTGAVQDTTYRCAAFLDADRFVVGTLGGQLLVYSSDSLKLLAVVASHGGAVWSVDVDPSGQTVAVACEDSRVRFFNIATADDALAGGQGEPLLYMPQTTTMVRPDSERLLSAAFSVDGKKIYYSDSTGRVACALWREGRTVWDADVTTTLQTLTSKQKMKATPNLPSLIWCITEVDGYVMCGTSRGEVKVLDPNTGVLLQSLRTHKADILALAQVDFTVFVTGVDNVLVALNVWEGDWIKSEGRNWCAGDVTALQPLSNGTLITGSLDGTLRACETRKMFPAQAGTGRHAIIHHQVPYWKHMFPYSTPSAATAVPSSKRLRAQKAVPAPAPRSMVACLDDFSVTLHQLPDSSTVGFRKRLLASKSSAHPEDEDESDIVAELRYNISGRYGVTCFDVDAGGRGFVYTTAERTSAVRLAYSSGSASSVEPLTLWEAEGVAPLPPATALTLHEGSLYLAHADGVVVIKDVFSPAEDLAARLRQVVSLPSPVGATSIAVTPAGAVVLGSGAASEGGVVTVLTRRAAPAAAAKGGKKRTAAEAAGGDFAGFDVSLTKSVRQEIVDLTLCEVKGTQCVFVVLRDGCVAAFSLTDGKSVWSMSNMPAAPRGFALPNRCDAAGQHVLVWNGEWFASLDLESKGYTTYKETTYLQRVKKADPLPETTLLALRRAPLHGACLRDGGKTLLLSAVTQENAFSLAPPCFWRKQYAT